MSLIIFHQIQGLIDREFLFTYNLVHILFMAVYLTTFNHRILLLETMYKKMTGKPSSKGYIKACVRLAKDSKEIFEERCDVYGNKCM